MGIIGTILRNMKNMKRAKAIRSMPRAELMAMDDEAFYDSVACVCDDAVYDFREQEHKLSREMIIAYTLTKFEAEVNNGGLCQFFVNSSGDCAPYVSEALAEVGAAEIQALYDAFVTENGIDVNDLSSFKLRRIEDYEAQTKRFEFDAFDERFYQDAELHTRIIGYLRMNLESIMK